MALWVCVNDRVPYSVGAPACPECGSTEHVEQDSPEHEALLSGKVPAVVGLEDDDVPSGSVDEVLDWVGEDLVRARRALVVERAGKDRRTLTEQLEKLVGVAE